MRDLQKLRERAARWGVSVAEWDQMTPGQKKRLREKIRHGGKRAYPRAIDHRRRKYGLSDEVYQEMIEAQGGRCLVCRRKTELCVDHDHRSGVVRGLLCRGCNLGIGNLKDDPVLLQRAIDYLMGY